MHARIAKYTVTGDVHDLSRRAEEGLVPIFEAQPGFKGYTVVTTGEKLISFSAWESAESAQAANAAAAEWVRDNLGEEIELKDSQIGEILFSTVLGVSSLSSTHA